MIRKTRMVAAVAAALVGTSMMVPAIASADSSVASTSFVSGAAASSTQETGVIQYDAVGDIGDGVQFEGPFALSAQLLGSLGTVLPNPGNGGGNQSGDAYASLFAYCDGVLLVTYDNSQKTTPTEFLLMVGDVQYDTEIVPAEESRDYVFDIPLNTVAAVSGDGVELSSLDTSDCFER